MALATPDWRLRRTVIFTEEKGAMPAVEVPVMRIENVHGLSAEIFSPVTPELLNCLVEAFSHVE